MRWSLLAGPTALALIVTGVNAVKPVLVDDTAYLVMARHVSAKPLDPYGFKILWYEAPDPAMEVLLPPVLPYWLALGMQVGEPGPAALKLWLLPFALLLTHSLAQLLHRFAPGTEGVALPLIVLSPAILTTVNLMLDVPALALGLTALTLLLKAYDRGRNTLAVASGVVLALALQTKYTMLVLPGVFLWWGLLRWRLLPVAIALVVAISLFAAWECYLIKLYGHSHFLWHLSRHGASDTSEYLRDKLGLLPALAGGLGCLAVGVGLYAGRAAGWPRRLIEAEAVAWLIGFAVIAALPNRWLVLIPGQWPGHDKLTFAALFWRSYGTVCLLTAAACAVRLLVRCRYPDAGVKLPDSLGWLRRSPENAFVVGWVLLEIAGYFAMSPFPAARRVIGPSTALGVLFARGVALTSRRNPGRAPGKWVLPFGVISGLLVTAVDTFDAFPEKLIAERSAVVARRTTTGTVWFAGRWGFQYYCDRAGMRAVVNGQSELRPGDCLVLPVFADEGFYRPCSVFIDLDPPPDAVVLIAELEWRDCLSAQTIPGFYGGPDPVTGRDHPRLKVRIYRVKKPWFAKGHSVTKPG